MFHLRFLIKLEWYKVSFYSDLFLSFWVTRQRMPFQSSVLQEMLHAMSEVASSSKICVFYITKVLTWLCKFNSWILIDFLTWNALCFKGLWWDFLTKIIWSLLWRWGGKFASCSWREQLLDVRGIWIESIWFLIFDWTFILLFAC